MALTPIALTPTEAALAAKYPHLAARVQGAKAEDLRITSDGKGKVLSRHRRYRLSDGSVVPLEEAEAPQVISLTVFPDGAAEAGRAVMKALDAHAEKIKQSGAPPAPAAPPAPKAPGRNG